MNLGKEGEVRDSSNTYLLIALVSSLSVFTVWLFFPQIVPALQGTIKNAGEFGDQFGSLNTLFTGLAFSLLICTTLMQSRELKFQRHELKQTRLAFEGSTEHQEANLSGNLLLPIFLYTRNECGKQIGKLATKWRAAARETLGEEDGKSILHWIKNEPDSDRTKIAINKVQEKLVSDYSRLREKYRNNDWEGEDDPDKKEFEEWDDARRKLSLVAQQVFQIKNANLVKDEKVMRMVAFSDFVSTYKYCGYPLDHHIERGRNPDAPNYPAGMALITLYSDEELRDSFY